MTKTVKKAVSEKAIEDTRAALSHCVSETENVEELRDVLTRLPREIWGDPVATVAVARVLFESEELYDLSLEGKEIFAELISSLFPADFWAGKENIRQFTPAFLKFLARKYEGISCADITAVFDRVPEDTWKDTVLSFFLIDTIVVMEPATWDLNCIEDVFPNAFFKDAANLYYAVWSILDTNCLNAAEPRLFPAATWEDEELILMILNGLEEALKYDRYHFTTHPNLRDSNKSYMENLLSHVSNKFKTSPDFLLDVLEHSYFSDAFDVVYGFMDASVFADRELVEKVLEMDPEGEKRFPK